MKKTKESRGITLIALVITIIILLILAGVTIATLTGENGILTQAQNAKRETTKAEAEEQFALIANEWMIAKRVGDKTLEQFINDKIKEGKLTGVADNGDGTYTIEINGSKKIIDQNGGLNNPFDTASWDENASSEDCFIWLSDDPNSEDYGTIIGYTSKASTYATLKYPSRCKRVEFTYNEERYNNASTTYSDARAFVRNIKEVELPGTVTTIGDYAFSGDGWHYFSSLEKINIPQSITSIGSEAFSGCSRLTSITIPGSVTNIGEYAFYECSSLSSVIIPDSLTSISNGMFTCCTSLSSITIPESVTSIGYAAFGFCTSLSSITIPENVTSIGYNAFCDCTSLSSITIPESVTSIGSGAFWNCTNLSSITIQGSVTSIDFNTFYGCTSLSSITLPDSVTSIGHNAFYDCTSLSSITMPESLTGIVGYTFYNCQALTSIEIPKNVTNIEISAFTNCDNLQSINVSPENTTYSSIGGVLYNKDQTAIILIPAGLNESNLPSNLGILESAHPYSNSMSTYYTKTIEGASELKLFFDSQCYLEDSWDYIEIYDGNDNLVYTSKGNGQKVLAENTITVSGDTVKIKLITDGSVTYWGFKCIVNGIY